MPVSNTQTTRQPRTGNLIIPPADERDRAPERKQTKVSPPKPAGWLAYLALLVLTLGSYAPLLQSDFVWSEYDEVERSPYESMDSWTEAWSLENIRGGDPFTLSSYFLESTLPLAPAVAHHLINILLHAAAAVLFLKVLDALKLTGAFSASLVFALHPAIMQTVFWSGYRSELLGFILILLALYFGIRHQNARDFYLMTFFSAVVFILHPGSLVLPLVLGLCIFYQKKSFHLRDYNRLLPLLCLALFLGVWTQGNQASVAFEPGERLSLYAHNMFFYLKQGLLPLELALFHPFNLSDGYNVGAQNNFLPFLLFLPFYILIAFNYKKQWARAWLLGLTAYLLFSLYGLTARGRFIDGSTALENHYQYIALPLLVAMVVCSLTSVAHKMGTGGRILWILCFGLFAILQLAITTSYALTVSDRARMWYTLSEQWPDAWRPKLALIHTIQASGEKSELLSQTDIIETLEDILNQQPDLLAERQLLARIYRDEGQNTNALRQYKRILRDAEPDNDFLREAAAFYDKLGLSWDANNARERITE